jgi:hypothetical protein
MVRPSKSFLSLFLSGVLLVGGPLAGSSRAKDAERAEMSSTYPVGSEAAFEWQYSCAAGGACSFNCFGSGGASSVTKLSIRLMNMPLGEKNVAGVFYEYSTIEISHANGFNISTGLGKLACQVNGMQLDYSGLPRKNEPPPVERNDAPAVTSSIAQ